MEMAILLGYKETIVACDRCFGDAIVTLEWDDDDEVQEYYLAIREMKPALTVTKKDLIAELKRCYEELDELEYRLEMAEDVLSRSDWNSVYRELIVPPE